MTHTMKIRSITTFIDPGWPFDRQLFRKAGEFSEQASAVFAEAGYEIQTTRLAVTSFVRLLNDPEARDAVPFARAIEAEARRMGFSYVSIGPVPLGNAAAYEPIPQILAETENVFVTGLIAEGSRISLESIRSCARVIRRASTITPDGFTNLRFGALANVPPAAPFFPGAYHAGGEPVFTLATESASLAVRAFSSEASLDSAADRLVREVEENAEKMAERAGELARSSGFRFGGIDFSLAPFPEESRSLGAAMENLGAPAVGLHGSLAAAAFIAGTLDRARYPRAGYNGMMLPVLEDAVLAKRAGEGVLSVSDLLVYSAVCGVGLDTVPIPGDTGEDQLASILLDIAALSCRLQKPLTARLMPIPGKRAGDPTNFDFAYFANSRVMAVSSTGLSGLLAGGDVMEVNPLGTRIVTGIHG